MHILNTAREKQSIIITHVFIISVLLFLYPEVLNSLGNILGWRIFFGICFREGLLAVDSLSFPSEKVFVLMSLLKDMCAAYRIPCWKFLSLRPWPMVFHCLLRTLVSNEKPSSPSNYCSHICNGLFFVCFHYFFFIFHEFEYNVHGFGFLCVYLVWGSYSCIFMSCTTFMFSALMSSDFFPHQSLSPLLLGLKYEY